MSITGHETGSASSAKEGVSFVPFFRWLAIAAAGNTGMWCINQGFDYVLYPIAPLFAAAEGYGLLASFGLTLLVMIPLSIVSTLGIIWLVERFGKGKDPLGIKRLQAFVKVTRKLSERGFKASLPKPDAGWRRVLYPISAIKFLFVWTFAKFASWKHGDIAAFIGFSYYDPTYGVLYMRKPADRGRRKFTPRDWKFFSLAVLIANVPWTIFVVLLAPLLVMAYNFASGYLFATGYLPE